MTRPASPTFARTAAALPAVGAAPRVAAPDLHGVKLEGSGGLDDPSAAFQ